ncbi:hypothetical protein Aple_053370 [Acrocarpospora pleiomorpha]|uniref:Carboxymuconolactone decarboxylase-like domain-containing protein n=1 Tax=Acrocarpospora pleiomorpha TaxID=90975 RepID=A0A5M3XNB3_9ACTN|nr:hypothetical protein [Acrocarpospora pleiomorpha]GES22440.1 hypothetical protein Aple_053370 [Acrocarpospora pleiomorpha]
MMTTIGFLGMPEADDDAKRIFEEDVEELGYVMNVSRLWAYQPRTVMSLFGLLREASSPHGLDARQRSILVVACASAFGDSYCSLSWGVRLAGVADEAIAAGVLLGTDAGLSDQERAMARWARKLARDPNRTTEADIQELRDVGIGDDKIFAMTVFVALRLAFSTVNDALGVPPDSEYRTHAPAAVLNAVTYGRPFQDDIAS